MVVLVELVWQPKHRAAAGHLTVAVIVHGHRQRQDERVINQLVQQNICVCSVRMGASVGVVVRVLCLVLLLLLVFVVA